VKDALRATELIGRFGVEWFIGLIPGTARDEAEKVIQRLLHNCRQQTVSFAGNDINITASAGLGEVLVDVQSSIRYVDESLYRAKDEGRDRIAIAAGERTLSE